MQFVDLSAQQARIKNKIDANIQRVLDHGQYIMGPEIRELEEKLAAYVGVKHAIGCSSGTDALLLALMAKGVGPGKAVFTTTFSFIATAEVIGLLGAIPVFVDIDPQTFNIDPEQLKLAIHAIKNGDSSIYPLPKIDLSEITPAGIIAVDLFGLSADYDRINKIAAEDDLFVIEDAAQSFGAEFKGKKACGLAEIACTSFFPAKPLGAYGDGGMCFTNDKDVAHYIRSILFHGRGESPYDNLRIGINGRLDTIQAAILLSKFTIFKEEVIMRDRVADLYTNLFSACSNDFATQVIPEGYTSVWAQYSLVADDSKCRLDIQQLLKMNGIPTAIYYPKPLHLQPAFNFLKYQAGDFPISDSFATRIFSIPMHPYLSRQEQERIVSIITSL